MTSPTLPPWIVPTLPTAAPAAPAAQLPPSITPTLPPTAQPAGTTTETTPSGLVVVRNRLTEVSQGQQLVVPSAPLTGNGAVEAAKAAYAEVAAAHGSEAADVLLRDAVELTQRVRNDELRAQAIAALLAGDVETAAKLISQQG